VAIKGRRATFEEWVAACRALEKGIAADEVAGFLRVSRASVFEWQKAYRLLGADGLRTKKTRAEGQAG
jgi:transposase